MQYFLDDEVGFVRVIDYMGSDLTAVNAARASFNKQKETLDSKDERLIKFLAEAEPAHTTPFRHAMITFQVKAPLFVARQWQKHLVGCEWSHEQYKDAPWSEQSGRYIEYDGYWKPKYFRIAAENKKQGSIDTTHPNSLFWLGKYEDLMQAQIDLYNDMVEDGIAPEQARAMLGMAMYTNFYWTASFQAVAHFVNLRDHEEAQQEIKKYAHIIGGIMEQLWPKTWQHRRRL